MPRKKTVPTEPMSDPPVEITEASDRYHRLYENSTMRRSYTRECGVTKELAPDAWQEINTGADRLAKENNINFNFPFTPISPGDIFSCGDYHFEIVPLYGHTSGQCGLVERNKKLFFCADQVILGFADGRVGAYVIPAAGGDPIARHPLTDALDAALAKRPR